MVRRGVNMATRRVRNSGSEEEHEVNIRRSLIT